MYQVDAFSTDLFKGNPAAVIITAMWLDEVLMQNIALENNLSETAFVRVIDAQNYEIRWFTPSNEIDFCGHATLASSFVLFQDYTSARTIYFHVHNLGIFVISLGDDGRIRMDFPMRKPLLAAVYPEHLQQALGIPLGPVYINQQAFIVLCDHAEMVKNLKPDFALIEQIGQVHGRAVAVTAYGDGRYDCVSRYFAPHQGIPEDPVTGSLHTAIAPLWAEKLGKSELLAYQASKRGGELYCMLKVPDRVEISGYAKLYMQAELYL